ncbi:hypothetical protein [Streptomyces sp. NPDC056227]
MTAPVSRTILLLDIEKYSNWDDVGQTHLPSCTGCCCSCSSSPT